MTTFRHTHMKHFTQWNQTNFDVAFTAQISHGRQQQCNMYEFKHVRTTHSTDNMNKHETSSNKTK